MYASLVLFQCFLHLLVCIFYLNINYILQIDGINGRQLTFREVVTKIEQLSIALLRRGVHQGDTLCTVLPNVIEFPIILYATVQIGAIVTACNPRYTTGKSFHYSVHFIQSIQVNSSQLQVFSTLLFRALLVVCAGEHQFQFPFWNQTTVTLSMQYCHLVCKVGECLETGYCLQTSCFDLKK